MALLVIIIGAAMPVKAAAMSIFAQQGLDKIFGNLDRGWDIEMAAGANVKKSGLDTVQSSDLLDFLLHKPRNRSGISSCCQGVLLRLLVKKKPLASGVTAMRHSVVHHIHQDTPMLVSEGDSTFD